jgi:hypothetical protein
MGLKGTTIQIAVKTQTGTDPFGAPIYETEFVDVPDVLVGQPTTDDIKSSIDLFGKKIEYMLGIPKGDSHDWVDADVLIWGQPFRTFGFPITGEQANIPLRWGQNVRVGRYE